MAGGLSMECDTCKRRRIKCDATHPICQNCQKARRVCARSAPVFVAKYLGQHSHSDSNVVVFDTKSIKWHVPRNRLSRTTSPWNQQTTRPRLAVNRQHDNIEHSTNQDKAKTIAHPSCLIPSVHANECQMLQMEIIHAIESTKDTGFTLQFIGKHFKNLPVRIGQSDVLDTTISCFLCAHRRLQNPAVLSREREHKLYGRALSSMQAAVESATSSDFEAIVAATIVMGDYEIFNNEMRNLTAHARGAEAVLKAWGPDRVQTSWAFDLLTTMTSAMVATALSTGEKCFLDTAEWVEAFDRAASQPTLSTPQRIDIMLYKAYSQLPAVLNDMQRHSADMLHKTEQRISAIWLQILAIDELVGQVMKDPVIVSEIPSCDHDSPFETYYQFADVEHCETMCHHWMFFISISDLVQQYLPRGPSPNRSKIELERTRAAINICKCIESVQHLKPLGTFFFHVDLPRAAIVLEGPYRVWALSAYREIVESAWDVGFDIVAPVQLLNQSLSTLETQAAVRETSWAPRRTFEGVHISGLCI